MLGSALLAAGEASRATWPLAAAARLDPTAVEAGLLLADALIESGNPEDAVRAADAVLEIDPDSVPALEFRVRAHLLMGRYDAALPDAERILRAHPDRVLAVGARALALHALEGPEAAAAAFEQLEEISGAEDRWLAGLICLGRAALLEEQGLKLEAEEALQTCVARFPDDPRIVHNRVEALDASGRTEEATDILRDAVARNRGGAAFSGLLAHRLQRAGRGTEAEKLLAELAQEEPSVSSWMALADLQRQNGNPAGGRATLERGLAFAPRAPELLFRYADVLVDLGQLSEAEEALERLGEGVFSDLVEGRLHLARGDPAAALSALSRGIELWPNNPGARFLAGACAEQLGDFDRALSEYREAARSSPAATEAELALANLHLLLGQEVGALEFAVRYTRSHPQAVEGYLLVARTAARLGRGDAAERALGRLEEIGADPALVTSERAAVVRQISGPAQAAAVVERSGLDLGKIENELSLRSLLEDLVALGDREKALALVRKLRSEGEPHAALLSIEGALLIHLETPDEAIRSFELALELDPSHPAALAGLGTVLAQRGDTRRAIAVFDKAAAAAPNDPSPSYKAAQLSRLVGPPGAPEERLRELLSRHPSHAGAANDLAWLLAEEERELDLALALAQRAGAIAPGSASADTLGWVLFKRGETARSLSALRAAAAADDPAAGTRYRLALALEAEGHSAEARHQLEQALASDDFPEEARARAALARLR